MKKTLLILFLTVATVISVSSQTRGRPEGTPDPVIDPVTDAAKTRGNEISRRSDNLRLSENLPVKTEKDRKIVLEQIEPIYRPSTDEELKFIAPDSADSEKYAAFLSEKDTGLIKLVTDRGCAANPAVVNTSPECAGYTMPGAGAAYSFRFRDYRILDLSDLNFRKNRFESLGKLNHGIMVNLGDTPLEDVTLETNGVPYLTKFKPAKDMSSAGETAQKLTGGIQDGDFMYASIALVDVDKTYVIRVIAYQGVSPKTVGGVVFNEMELDKREDIIVAFRVVRLVPGESVTILWKELKSRKSPKLKSNN